MVRLGDACIEDKVIVDGKSSKLPYLGLEMIESETGKIDWSAKTVAGISTCFAFDARHILYSKLRPYLNKVALPDVEGRCTTEIIPLLPKEGVCREYIAYLLRGQQTVDYVTPENSGTRMPRADMKHLFNMRIPLPPLSEQRRIAAEIERQLAAVEKARRAAAEQVAASGEIGSLYLQGVFSNNKWDTQRLGEIVDVTTGPFGSMLHKADYVSKGIPIINPQDIKSGTICPSTFVSLETANRLQAYALNTGDIVIGRRGEMGRCAVIGSDQNRWLCGTECFILRKSAKLFPDYFAMFLRNH